MGYRMRASYSAIAYGPPPRERFTRGPRNVSRAHTKAPTTCRAGKEPAPEYDSDSDTAPGHASDSSPLFGFYLDSAYEFDFGSDPEEPESEDNSTEQPLSGPAAVLVITSTPAGRFVYWPDRKPPDLTGGNSRYVAYLDSLPFQEGTPLTRAEEYTPREVASSTPVLATPTAKSSWLLATRQDPQGQQTTDTSKTFPQTGYLLKHPRMRLTPTGTLDVSVTESGTNDAGIFETASPSAKTQRLSTKSRVGYTPPRSNALCRSQRSHAKLRGCALEKSSPGLQKTLTSCESTTGSLSHPLPGTTKPQVAARTSVVTVLELSCRPIPTILVQRPADPLKVATALQLMAAIVTSSLIATLAAEAVTAEAPAMGLTGGLAAEATVAAEATRTAISPEPHRAASMPARRLKNCGRRSPPP
jgi:hypothetical protein